MDFVITLTFPIMSDALSETVLSLPLRLSVLTLVTLELFITENMIHIK